MGHYLGVINKLLDGSYNSLSTNKKIEIPIEEIIIEESILDVEFNFTKKIFNQKNLILSGKNSYQVFGEKVLASLKKNNVNCEIKILDEYETSKKFAEDLANSLSNYQNIITIGSGSVIDISKFVSSKNNQNLYIFCSSLSAAATTSTVSLLNKGIKESVNSKIPDAIIIDLENLKNAPPRLLRSSLGDVLCRSTCQIDWLTSHLLLNTKYDETPFALQYEDEAFLLKNSKKILQGDYDTLAALSRMTLLNGIAAIIIGSTHAGSMGEHLISHYIDMFMGNQHPNTLHGEQVGVATIQISKMQNQFIKNKTLKFNELNIDEKIFQELFGDNLSSKMFEQFKSKYFNADKIEFINDLLEKNWSLFRAKLAKYLLPTDNIIKALVECGACVSNEDLKISGKFFNEAIHNSFLLRDRFSYLDIAHYTKTIQEYLVKE